MWIFLTLTASVLQAFRNSFQRGLLNSAGVWAATWVRFAFGVPVSGALVGILFLIYGPISILKIGHFAAFSSIGACAQILGTMTLLKSMENSSFALGATLQHSSLAITAVFGTLFLGDIVHPIGWIGIGLASIGMILASWPRGKIDKFGISKDVAAGAWGLASGICFAISVNSFRGAVLSVNPNPSFYASVLTVTWVQFIQGLFLGTALFYGQRQNFDIAIKSWRESLSAGSAGAGASILWFFALALVPAAMIKAVNLLIESPTSIIIGAIKFKEKLPLLKLLAIGLIVFGVIMAIIPPKHFKTIF